MQIPRGRVDAQRMLCLASVILNLGLYGFPPCCSNMSSVAVTVCVRRVARARSAKVRAQARSSAQRCGARGVVWRACSAQRAARACARSSSNPVGRLLGVREVAGSAWPVGSPTWHALSYQVSYDHFFTTFCLIECFNGNRRCSSEWYGVWRVARSSVAGAVLIPCRAPQQSQRGSL